MTACPFFKQPSRTGLVFGSLTALFLWSAPAAFADDSFIAGYATAILEREFAGQKISVRVTEGVIVLQAQDIQGRERDKVVGALTRIAGVREVRIEEGPAQSPGPEAPRLKQMKAPRGSPAEYGTRSPRGSFSHPCSPIPDGPTSRSDMSTSHAPSFQR